MEYNKHVNALFSFNAAKLNWLLIKKLEECLMSTLTCISPHLSQYYTGTNSNARSWGFKGAEEFGDGSLRMT